MSMLNKIKAFFTGGSRSEKLYIIDAAQLAGGGNERLGPREQIQVLQQLSRFAEKEKIGIQAVFEGRALREVAHGENYGGIQVFFAENAANVQTLLLDLLKKGLRSKQALVVTSSRPVEERALSMGGSIMRPMTFRKAFEDGGGDRGERGRGDSRRRDRRRPPRQQRPHQEHQTPPGGGEQSVAAVGGTSEQPPQKNPSKEKDSVRDLIDLVE
jgi:hypothetical protein